MVDEKPLAVVTGASSGIGAALARRIAREGHPLALVARRRDKLDALAAELPVDTHVITQDLAVPDAAEQVAGTLAARQLVPGIVVNNAGFGQLTTFADAPVERQVGMVDLNVRVLVALTHRFLPAMLAAGRGGIINVASTAAFQPGPGMAVYYASKAFVLSFSEGLWEETRSQGVTVTALCPGPTATEFGTVSGMANSRIFRYAHNVSQSADAVADQGWRGFQRGRRVVVPGFANKITAASTHMIPRRLLLPMISRLQRTD